tara:strand:+ start:284 stop:670 length:387 start_codon:yes stop_codon:yes gene_type:complete
MSEQESPVLRHFMIDLETTAITTNAGVLQIGIVEFEPTGTKAEIVFDRTIRLEDALAREYDEETMLWWQGQDQAILAGTETESEVIADMMTVFPDIEEVMVWANGIDFDLPILSNLITDCGHHVPWHF